MATPQSARSHSTNPMIPSSHSTNYTIGRSSSTDLTHAIRTATSLGHPGPPVVTSRTAPTDAQAASLIMSRTPSPSSPVTKSLFHAPTVARLVVETHGLIRMDMSITTLIISNVHSESTHLTKRPTCMTMKIGFPGIALRLLPGRRPVQMIIGSRITNAERGRSIPSSIVMNVRLSLPFHLFTIDLT